MTELGNAPTASMLSQPQDANILNGHHSVSPQIQAASLQGEPLVCQWQGCQQPNHSNAETLYDHVCENHIGRKSTNNLNLQCFWGSCRTTTVKRDHITSHIRVHVPLKPHKCEFCQKSFKRPQDLKKHVKTHADESVLFNSPQQSGSGSRPPNGYQVPSSGRQDGSYNDGPAHMGYPYGNGQAPFHGGNGISAANFGGYPFSVPQTSSYDNGGLTESRKRAHDNMNDFFGAAKRRNIDAGQYQDLGAQFSQFLQMFAPFAASGWNSGYNSAFGGGPAPFDNGGGVQYQTQAAPAMASFNAPFPELKTKNDLMSIDQFLEQLQHTVYDNETAVNAFQPVSGMQPAGFPQFGGRQSSNSPPRFMHGAGATSSSISTGTGSTFDDSTPALTPSSYGSTHSPRSTHQQASPNFRAQGGSLYPTLPSISALESHNQFAGLPPSNLGPQYDEYDGRRRYSGGLLQKAQPVREAGDTESPDSVNRSSKNETMQESIDKDAELESSPGQQNVKLPGVSEITRKSEGAEQKDSGERNEAKEAWARNVRTIETLRRYIQERLARGDFGNSEGSDDGNRTPRANQDIEMKDEDTSEGQATTPKREGASLYPVLRPVEA